jgi:hypothetical protein
VLHSSWINREVGILLQTSVSSTFIEVAEIFSNVANHSASVYFLANIG